MDTQTIAVLSNLGSSYQHPLCAFFVHLSVKIMLGFFFLVLFFYMKRIDQISSGWKAWLCIEGQISGPQSWRHRFLGPTPKLADSVGLGGIWEVCVYPFPGKPDADVAGVETTLWEPLHSVNWSRMSVDPQSPASHTADLQARDPPEVAGRPACPPKVKPALRRKWFFATWSLRHVWLKWGAGRSLAALIASHTPWPSECKQLGHPLQCPTFSFPSP